MYLLCALKDKEPVVREEAASALSYLKPLHSITPFLSVLGDENARVRLEAVKAISRMGAKKAVEPLVRALSDQDAGVRESACIALASLGKSAIAPLKAVSSDDARAFSTAAKALGMIERSHASKRVKHTTAMPDVDSIIETEMDFNAYDKAGQARLSSFNI
jgi:HEAT repeat protein